MSSPNLNLLAIRLADTLDQEAEALTAVRDALAGLLAAVRSGSADGLVARAEGLHDLIHTATEHRAAHRRQVELFFRISGEQGESLSDVLLTLQGVPDSGDSRTRLSASRQQIRDIAAESGRLVAATNYALSVSGQVNHELIMLLHGLMQPDGGRVYTSRGGTSSPRNRRSMIDRRG